MSNLFYFLRRETNADLLVYRLARTCFACVLVTGQWPRPLATWFCNKHWFGIGNYYLQKITSSQTVEVSRHFKVAERNNPYLLSTNIILSTPVLITRQTAAHPVPWDFAAQVRWEYNAQRPSKTYRVLVWSVLQKSRCNRSSYSSMHSCAFTVNITTFDLRDATRFINRH